MCSDEGCGAGGVLPAATNSANNMMEPASAPVFREAQPPIGCIAAGPHSLGSFDVTGEMPWLVLHEPVEAEIAAQGAFRVDKVAGVVRCWKV